MAYKAPKKKEYEALVKASEIRLQVAERNADIIRCILQGSYEFLAMIPGHYQDETGYVYRIKRMYGKRPNIDKTTHIVVLQRGQCWFHESIQALIDHTKKLSDLPHNLETIKILENLQDKS